MEQNPAWKPASRFSNQVLFVFQCSQILCQLNPFNPYWCPRSILILFPNDPLFRIARCKLGSGAFITLLQCCHMDFRRRLCFVSGRKLSSGEAACWAGGTRGSTGLCKMWVVQTLPNISSGRHFIQFWRMQTSYLFQIFQKRYIDFRALRRQSLFQHLKSCCHSLVSQNKTFGSSEYVVTSLDSLTHTHPVDWVRERTIPTERPPLVGEVSANLCG
jgi:hypothetical protein